MTAVTICFQQPNSVEYVVGLPTVVWVFLTELNLFVRHDAKTITAEVCTRKNSILQTGK